MSHPTKEQVRKWQKQRIVEHTPPKTPEEIRRELGWELVPKPNTKEERNKS